ncbi:polyprenyl synthetase family protein [Janibacter sp. GXQ6167]|uniref:polyprenyl synthetase family protein n=1 Tax=Janibacter sp. GXQ6167 TaxID=3240791 RepID=UPI003524825C
MSTRRDPLAAADLRPRVQARLDAVLAEQRELLAEVGPDVADLTTPITDLLRGGKRLRAAFLYWGWRVAGAPDEGRDDEGVIALAASMELFQAAALIHDDVMDDSDTRRGLPAAHRVMAADHAERAWRGDPDRFGLAGALLAGNLCLVWCDDLYEESGVDPVALAAARPVFHRMRTQLMAGQFIDVVESMRPWTGLGHDERVQRARHVIRYKSAKYSIEHPLLIGATAGGASAADLDHLSDYGLALGEAFQLRDDILGVFGDPETTGKPAGDDLREGKRTVLVARTLAACSDDEAAVLEASLGDGALTESQVDDLREIMTRSGAVAAVESDIDRLIERAHQALQATTGLDPEALEVLHELIDATTARQA